MEMMSDRLATMRDGLDMQRFIMAFECCGCWTGGKGKNSVEKGMCLAKGSKERKGKENYEVRFWSNRMGLSFEPSPPSRSSRDDLLNARNNYSATARSMSRVK